MLLLTAINEILPKLGERPVTSVESKSPSLAVIIPQIESQIRQTLIRGWWFNEFKTTLYPDSEGKIASPDNILKFVADAEFGSIVHRGEWMYNGDIRDYFFDRAVTGKLTEYVPFEELPESAAQYVLYSALVVIYATDIGLEQVVNLWRELASAGLAAMTSEHLANKRYSIKNSPRYIKLRRAMRN